MNSRVMAPSAMRTRALAVAILVAGAAGGNEANYQLYIVGDRASGMGGAVCAVADSVDACFFNPAGLTRLDRNSVSVSGNIYGYQQSRMNDWLYPGEDAEAKSVVSIPSSIAYVRRVSPALAVAVSAFVPQSIQYNQMDAYTRRDHYYNFSLRDESIWFGPGVAWRVSPAMSVGVSVFGVYRSYSRAEDLLWGDSRIAYSDSLQYHALGVVPQVGLQCRSGERWNLGLAVQAPSQRVSGNGRFHQYTVVGAEGAPSAGAVSADDLDADDAIPPALRAGVAWEKPRALAFGLDLTWHFSADWDRLEGEYADGTPAELKGKREAVTDINAGVEWYVAQNVPLRAGVFTSFSSAPDVSAARPEYPAQIDLYGFTASIGRSTADRSFAVGVNYVTGSGDSLAWDTDAEGRFQVVKADAEETHVYVTLSAAYYY